jgi:peptide-methionine (S)-S-oxide reductase
VVKVTYDPKAITYGQLLKVFFATHDPTQLNRQGPDVGPQYRSAIFYADQREREIAAAYIEQLEQAGVYDEPIVTTIEPLDAFYPAEGHHQDYVRRNPDAMYVRIHALPKVEKVRDKFDHLVE